MRFRFEIFQSPFEIFKVNFRNEIFLWKCGFDFRNEIFFVNIGTNFQNEFFWNAPTWTRLGLNLDLIFKFDSERYYLYGSESD